MVRGTAAPRIVVAGTGRAGSTFLMRLLTEAGLDTGYVRSGDWYLDTVSGTRASGGPSGGLERHPRAGWAPSSLDALPRVVKDPRLSLCLGPLLDAGHFRAEVVLVPYRDLPEAAASRIRTYRLWLPGRDPEVLLPPGAEAASAAAPGGLQGAQTRALLYVLNTLYDACHSRGVPLVVLPFAELTRDPAALHARLAPYLGADVSLAALSDCHRRLSP